MLEIRTFGGLQLASGGNPITDLASRKAEALLVYLAVTGRPQPREVLADFFWDERTQTQAMANLRTVLSSLRKNLGEYVEISRDYAAIRPDAEVWLDLSEFEQRLGAARLDEAVALYQGDFLEGFHIRDSTRFDDWLAQERQRCLKSLQEGLHAWVRYHAERGSYLEGIAYAEQLLVIDPLDEEAVCQLMPLLSLSGQRAAALKRYEDFCEVLDRELGVEPATNTAEVYQQILSGDPLEASAGLAQPERETRAVGACPYRGLAPFREVDAPFFYGREEFTHKLEDAVQNGSVVTVIVGASGSGKSSTVFAGLFPALRKNGDWQILTLRPGRQPFENLAAEIVLLQNSGCSEHERLEMSGKLAFHMQHQPGRMTRELDAILNGNGSASRLLLAVDQFEELYTLCPEVEVQHRFLDELLTAVEQGGSNGSGSIVLLQTLRADFMGQALAYRPFADVLQNAALMLGPMNRGELRSVIVDPAEKQGAAFEPGLVERILNDVGAEPGNLPLLEFALTLLWERLDYGWLTHAAYEEIGQVAGALTRYAEEVFAGLNESHRYQARRIFTQLVQPGEGAEDTRRVATREELAGSEWSLIQFLADKRLVVTGIDQEGSETVEVVHEALIRSWGRLKNWMEQDRAFRSWQEGLRAAIRQWEANQEDEGGLLRGRPLTQAESWLEERSTELSGTDIRFIQASIELRDRRERERARLRRRVFAGLAAGLVVTLVLAVFSFIQRNQAQESYSMSLAAHVENALEEQSTDTALALAMAANEIKNPPAEVVRVLRQAAYAPGPIQRLAIADILGHDGQVYSLAVSPVENTALMGMDDGVIFLWDFEKQEIVHRLEGHTDVVQDLSFSSDGRSALSASHDGLVILWDLETGREVRRFTGHSGWVRAVDFSPDGLTMFSGGYSFIPEEDTDVPTDESIIDPGELFLWDIKTGAIIQRFEGHPSGVVAAAFTPDGRSILASSGLFIDIQNEYSMYLWDVETGQIIHDFLIDADSVRLAISPDGRMALSGDYLSNVHVWDLETGTEIQTLLGHEGIVRSLNFSPDGSMALTSDSVGTMILWDTSTWTKLMQAKVHQAGGQGWSRFVPWVNNGISPDGRFALSTAEDQTLIIWDLVGAVEIRRFEGHQDMVVAVAFTPDGQYALTGTGSLGSFAGVPGIDNNIYFWDVQTGELLHVFEGHTDMVWMIAVSGDGTKMLSGSLDGTLRLWDLESREEIRTIFAHQGGVFAVAINDDGSLGLSGSMSNGLNPDDGITLWDLQSGEKIHHVLIDSNPTSLLFLADGQNAMIDSTGLNLLNLEIGEITESYTSYEACCTGFVLDPNNSHSAYAVTNTDTTIREWDLEKDEFVRNIGGPHGGMRTRLEITPDGKRLFSGGNFGSMFLWDLTTGEELYAFSGGQIVVDIDMTPDGKIGLTSGLNNTAILWNLDLPIELDDVRDWIAGNRYVRALTCEERATYSIEPLCEGEGQ